MTPFGLNSCSQVANGEMDIHAAIAAAASKAEGEDGAEATDSESESKTEVPAQRKAKVNLWARARLLLQKRALDAKLKVRVLLSGGPAL